MAQLRREERDDKGQSSALAAGKPLEPYKAAVLLLIRAENCSEAEQAAIAQLEEIHPELASSISFTKRFAKMIRERHGSELKKWLSDAEASGIREVKEFARKVCQDEAAVQAGCTLEWSNGQTEGQITRIKVIKRQMYGRAKFDLLRQRVLHAA